MDFIEVNSTGEGYFIEDRDTVYCRHGVYIGYPGGIDYMCHNCEMGYNKLESYTEFSLTYLGNVLLRSHSPMEVLKLLGKFLKIANKNSVLEQFINDIDFSEREVYYWTD